MEATSLPASVVRGFEELFKKYPPVRQFQLTHHILVSICRYETLYATVQEDSLHGIICFVDRIFEHAMAVENKEDIEEYIGDFYEMYPTDVQYKYFHYLSTTIMKFNFRNEAGCNDMEDVIDFIDLYYRLSMSYDKKTTIG